MKSKYDNTWLFLAQITPKEGYRFSELVDSTDVIDEADGNLPDQLMVGAWANMLVKASDIRTALDVIDRGCREQGFHVNYVDKAENIASLISDDELDSDVRKEVNWLLKSNYCFKISGRIFPFSKGELR